MLAGVLALVVATVAAYAWWWQALPRFFVPGQGLTPFKVGCELVLIAMYLVIAGRLGWCLHAPRTFHASGLLAAACVLAEGGVLFSLYGSTTDLDILLGHAFKAVAYVFLYQAVFAETVRRPYALLRASRQQLQLTLDALPDLLFELDADGRYLAVHAGRPSALVAARERLLGRTVREVMPASEADTVMAALAEAQRGGVSRGKLIALDTIGGSRRWFELSVAARMPGQAGGFVVISHDVTERRRADEDRRKLSAAVAQSPVAIIITGLDERIEYVNEAFTRHTGYPAVEAIGCNVRELLQSGEAASIRAYREAMECLAQGIPWQGELVNRTKSGREIVEAVLLYPLRDAQGRITHYLAHHEDITEKKRAVERIQWLSLYDRLTGLPNATMLREHFQHARAQGEQLAVLWIDLDRFKDVNDSLGHGAGDQLLQAVAQRLLAPLTRDQLLARHSGDGFVMVAPQADQAAAAHLAQALLLALAPPVALAGQELFCTASIGIALSPDDGHQLEALLRDAEAAMYRAKEDGRNRYCFFALEMQAHTTRTLALGNALKQALARGELQLAYQPQIAFADGRVTGAETLLRWHSPRWGVVAPAEFIPIAEANGLIVPIGEWVLRTALAQWRCWRTRGLPPVAIAVNLSAVQFNQPGLADHIGHLLDVHEVPPEFLELEITEAVAMKAPHEAARVIEALAQRRIRLAIDDFGTGYSSLSYLKQFRISRIKIDQAFVRDLGVDPDDQAIVTAVIQMARSLGIATIAEGVETAEQRDFLDHRGCEEAQGYLYGRPMDAAAFEAFLRARGGVGRGRAAGLSARGDALPCRSVFAAVHHGQALFLLFGDERRQDHDAPAERVQLPRAWHAYADPHARARRPLWRRRGGFAHRPQGQRAPLRARRRPASAGGGRLRRAR